LNYRQTLEMLERRGNEVQKIRLGLHRAATIMDAFGAPHLEIPAIHIAGTNGKGSVAAMTESILQQGGWRTGTFTSPHLERVEERIRVEGRRISARRMAALATEVHREEKGLLERGRLDMPLTYFEFVTACALLHFAAQRVDLAVVEVGLGGQLDATNIVSPRVTVITGVSKDHQRWLGDGLEGIARAKAGIIKPGCPVVSGCRPGVARTIVRRRAVETAAPLTEIDRDCDVRVFGSQRGCYRFDLVTPLGSYRSLRPSLAGRFQVRNAALAVCAVEALGNFSMKVRGIRAALADVHWPGRMDEYPSIRRTLLEAGHNPEGASELRRFLQEHEKGEIHMVFGVMRDKDIRKIGNLLFPTAQGIQLCPVENARSALPSEVARIHGRYRRKMGLHKNSRCALQAAWRQCPANGLVVVTGSIYLLGELLPLIRSNLGK
jgi:dihydrofolate synthase/folylpolyglutamate synthase